MSGTNKYIPILRSEDSCSRTEIRRLSTHIFSDAESESQSKFDCQPVRRRSWSSATTAAEAEENTLLVSRMSTKNIGAKYVSGTFVTLCRRSSDGAQ